MLLFSDTIFFLLRKFRAKTILIMITGITWLFMLMEQKWVAGTVKWRGAWSLLCRTRPAYVYVEIQKRLFWKCGWWLRLDWLYCFSTGTQLCEYRREWNTWIVLGRTLSNPASNSVNILLKTNSSFDHLSIQMFNNTGQMVSSIEEGKSFDKGTHYYKLNTEQFPEGIYFVTVRSNNTIKTNKLIISNKITYRLWRNYCFLPC